VGDKTVSVSYTNSNGCTASAPAQFHVFLDSITVPGIVTGGSTISLGFSTDSLFATRYHGLILGWQKRHNGGMYTVIPNTGGHVSYIEIPDSTGTYDYQVLVKNGHCDTETSTSTTVTVIDGPVSRYWTGAVDIYWNKAGNWNPVGVPTYLDDVVIPGTVSNQPVVIIQGLACHNMNIVTGATVTINPGITLTINGNLTIGP
jgi:hypothetical protein